MYSLTNAWIWGGESGCPYYRYDSATENRYVVGVHRGGATGCHEAGRRLTVDWGSDIREMAAAPSPPAVCQVVELAVDIYSHITGALKGVAAGRISGSANADEIDVEDGGDITVTGTIFNVGNGATSTITVHVVASRSTRLTNVIEIGTFTLSIGASTTARRTWRGATAGLVTGRKYYVGFMWGGSGCYAPTRPADGVHVVDQFLVSGEVTPQPRTTRPISVLTRVPIFSTPPPTPSEAEAIRGAVPIACNGVAYGTTTDGVNYLGAPSPDRFYRLTLDAARNVTVHTCGGNRYDTYVRLYNEDMELIDRDDDHGGLCPTSSGASSLDSRLAARVLQPGTYIILVEGYSTRSGSYRLQVECTIPVFFTVRPVVLLPIVLITPPPTRPPFQFGMQPSRGNPTPPPTVLIGGGITSMILTRPDPQPPSVVMTQPPPPPPTVDSTLPPAPTPPPSNECTFENRPVIRMGTPNSGPPGTMVTLTGSFRTGPEIRAECCWRLDGRAYFCYQEATISTLLFAPTIRCVAPDLTSTIDGAPAPRFGDSVSVSVHVWHLYGPDSNRHGLCWSWTATEQNAAYFTYTDPSATRSPTDPEPPTTTAPPVAHVSGFQGRVFARPTSGTSGGSIQPINGAVVTFTTEDGTASRSDTSSIFTGTYRIVPLSPGRYTATVTHSNWTYNPPTGFFVVTVGSTVQTTHFYLDPVGTSDTHSTENGPNGRDCGTHGAAIDGEPQDNAYTCHCNVGYEGDNCERVSPLPTTAAPVPTFRFATCELNASLDVHPFSHGGHFEQLPPTGYCPCPSPQNCSYGIFVNTGIDMDAVLVWAETADGERVGRWEIGMGSYAMYEHATGSDGQPCPGSPNSTIENNQELQGYGHLIRWFPPTTAVGTLTFNGMWQTSATSRPGTYHFNPATLELNPHPSCALAAETLTAEPTPPPTTTPVIPTTAPPATCPRNCGQAAGGGGTCRDNGRCTSCNSNRVLQSGRCYQSLSCKGRRIQTGSTAGSGCRCLQADQCHWCTRGPAGDVCRVVSCLFVGAADFFVSLRHDYCSAVALTHTRHPSRASRLHLYSVARRGICWTANALNRARETWRHPGWDSSRGGVPSRSRAMGVGWSALT